MFTVNSRAKANLILLLQVGICIFGILILAALLWEPHLEGRNIDATLFQIYFNDPFLAYIYLAFAPFFIALYHIYIALGHFRMSEADSQKIGQSLKTVQHCLLTTAVLIAGAIVYIIATMSGEDDIAGGVAVGLIIIVSCLLASGVAYIFQKRVSAL